MILRSKVKAIIEKEKNNDKKFNDNEESIFNLYFSNLIDIDKGRTPKLFNEKIHQTLDQYREKINK